MRKLFKTLALVACLIVPLATIMTGCGKKTKTTPFDGDVWDGSVAEMVVEVENTYTITTAEQLAGFAKSVNEGITYEGKVVKLGANLDLRDIPWTAIGCSVTMGTGTPDFEEYENKAFKGTFDGQNHTIYNLKATKSATTFHTEGKQEGAVAHTGLFGVIYGTVKNVKVIDADVESNHFSGVICAWAGTGSVIQNCYVKDADVSCTYFDEDESGDKAGAIVGYLRESSLVDCIAINVEIDADRDAGQLVGCIQYPSTSELSDYINGCAVTNVEVEDNNTNQTVNQNIKNEIVGRINLV